MFAMQIYLFLFCPNIPPCSSEYAQLQKIRMEDEEEEEEETKKFRLLLLLGSRQKHVKDIL